MSTAWVRQEHIESLRALVPYIEDRTVRRHVKECVLGLSEELTATVSRDAVALAMDEPIAPLTEGELQAIQTLLAKGVQHNGLVPALDRLQVGRALQIVSALLARAQLAALSLDQQQGLEWVFDRAAEVGPEHREEIRQLEQVVRGGLGLTVRVSHLPPPNALPA